MKTYIMTKTIHAVPAKMVNGMFWPAGLPLPELQEPEQAPDGCTCANERLCNGTMPVSIEDGYLYTESNDDCYLKWMRKAEFEKVCGEPSEAACCAAEDEPRDCGCNEGECYGPVENMTFGAALEAVKNGLCVARKGWNGKGMYVFLADDVEFVTKADISEFHGAEDGVEVSAVLVLRTAQGTLQPGWLATQSDMLAEDWQIVK